MTWFRVWAKTPLAPVNSLCASCFTCLCTKPGYHHLWKRRGKEGTRGRGRRGGGVERAELWCCLDGDFADPREFWSWDDSSESPSWGQGIRPLSSHVYQPLNTGLPRKQVWPWAGGSLHSPALWAANSWAGSVGSNPGAGTKSFILCQGIPASTTESWRKRAQSLDGIGLVPLSDVPCQLIRGGMSLGSLEEALWKPSLQFFALTMPLSLAACGSRVSLAFGCSPFCWDPWPFQLLL